MYEDWLKQGLKQKGKSGGGLAAYLGIQASAISRMIKGKREVKAYELQKIAEYLELPPPDMGLNASLTPVNYISVIGDAAAGVWKESAVLEQEQVQTIPIVPTDNRERFAARITDKHCEAFLSQNGYVVYTPYWNERNQIQEGDTIVLRRTSEQGLIETTCRVVRKRGAKFELHYPSQNDAFKQSLTYHSEDELREHVIGLVIGTFVDQAPDLTSLFK